MPKTDIRKLKAVPGRGSGGSLKRAIKHFTTHKNGDFLNVPLDKLERDEAQPRKAFNDDSILDLAESIEDVGILQPILIRVDDKGAFRIVAGERRVRAATAAGLKTVPGIVTTGKPEEISLIENAQREDLTPIEYADAINRLVDDYGYSHSKIGRMLGKSRDLISQVAGLKRLPPEVRDDLEQSEHARQMITRRTLVEISKEPPAVARKLYERAKKGATSEDIRGARGLKTRPSTGKVRGRSSDEILIEKIQALTKNLRGFDDPGRVKLKVKKALRPLYKELERILA